MQDVPKRHKLRAITECMPPGTELPFAWDEPTADHTLRVAAQLRNFASHHHASGSERLLNIDDLPSKPLEPLVIRGSINTRHLEDTGQWQNAEAKARLEGALSEAVQRQVRPHPGCARPVNSSWPYPVGGPSDSACVAACYRPRQTQDHLTLCGHAGPHRDLRGRPHARRALLRHRER